jgi:hypothetical protein
MTCASAPGTILATAPVHLAKLAYVRWLEPFIFACSGRGG